ncbi:MAG: EpsI family protein [Gammaproteobacteria bacterium]|nr:EpsI family protein [Gammaproteobacteria bacterium]
MIKLPRMSLRVSLLICVLSIFAAIGAVVATPRLTEVENPPNLEETVPRQFGDWKERPSPYAQVSLATGNEENLDRPYDQTVMRTYVNSKGQMVMLALAWGRKQRQEVKVHRPDLCYVAQGYDVQSLKTVTFANIMGASGPVTGKRMVATSRRGGEVVSYWMRIGSLYSEDAVNTRLHILKEGLAGRIPDGILVRASQIISEGATPAEIELVHQRQELFLAELVQATPRSSRSLLAR